MFALNSLFIFSLFRVFLSRPEKKPTKPSAAMYCAVVEQLTDAKA